MDADRRLPFLRCHLLLLMIISLLFAASCFSTASSVRVPEEEKVTLELYYETLCPYCSIFIVDYLYKIFDNGLIDITNLKLIPYGNAKIKGNGTINCQKVSLGLYYESCCPYSAEFIVDDLPKIFYNGLIDIVDLNLVPWGNARLQGNSTFECQHGPDECLLNTIEACAIHVWPDVNEHFPFVYCVENLVYQGQYIQWGTCFEKLGLDRKPVDECYQSGLGKELELGYAAETNALQPPHTYVPWVTVDGQPLYDDYRDFISFICKAYKGTHVPPACSGLSTGNVKKMNTMTPVCHTGEKIKSIFSSIRSALRSWMQGVTVAALA